MPAIAKLDNDVRLVVLQFRFNNGNCIPQSIPYRLPKIGEARTGPGRKKRQSGVMLIQPTEKCSVDWFVEDLEAEGYELVDAFRECVEETYHSGKEYHRARFIFARHEFAEVSDSSEFGQIRGDLLDIIQDVLWRVRGYSNPFYKNGLEVRGVRTMCINLEMRQPLYDCNGEILVRQKDEQGRKTDIKVPLMADYNLLVDEEHLVRLVDNS